MGLHCCPNHFLGGGLATGLGVGVADGLSVSDGLSVLSRLTVFDTPGMMNVLCDEQTCKMIGVRVQIPIFCARNGAAASVATCDRARSADTRLYRLCSQFANWL